MQAEVENSINGVTRWGEEHRFRAYDPGDGNMSFLRFLLCKNLFLEKLLTAAVLRCPFNIRPWIGIKPHTSTKGMGYMARGYVLMYSRTGDEKCQEQAVRCLDWLMHNSATNWFQFSWGNHFAFVTRNGRSAPVQPNIVWSSLVNLAFLEAYEVLGNER